MAKRTGTVAIEANKCKGCGLCIAACPTHSLRLGESLNRLGYHPAEFLDGPAAPGAASASMPAPSRRPSPSTTSRRTWPERRVSPPTLASTLGRITHGPSTHQRERGDCQGAILAGCRSYYGYRSHRQRDRRGCREVLSSGRRHVRAGGVGGRLDLHVLRGGVGRRADDDRLVGTGVVADAGRDLVPGRKRAPLRHRRHHARGRGSETSAPSRGTTTRW